jgi:hypothetical protein
MIKTGIVPPIDSYPLNAGVDEPSLARDMIEVHGTAAAAPVARANARAAALAGQAAQAKSWIRVLGIIQRHQTDKENMRHRT